MIDIIVTTCENDKKDLEKFLDSLERNTTYPFNLTICDDGSSNQDELIKYFNKYRVVLNPKHVGLAANINSGLKLSKSEWVFKFDSDVLFPNNWLTTLMEDIPKIKGVGLVGFKFLKTDRSIYFTALTGDGNMDKKKDEISFVDFVFGTGLMISRKAMLKVGLFDENYYPYKWEDKDYCIRIHNAGFKVLYYGKLNFVHTRGKRPDPLNLETEKYFKRKWGGFNVKTISTKD